MLKANEPCAHSGCFLKLGKDRRTKRLRTILGFHVLNLEHHNLLAVCKVHQIGHIVAESKGVVRSQVLTRRCFKLRARSPCVSKSACANSCEFTTRAPAACPRANVQSKAKDTRSAGQKAGLVLLLRWSAFSPAFCFQSSCTASTSREVWDIQTGLKNGSGHSGGAIASDCGEHVVSAMSTGEEPVMFVEASISPASASQTFHSLDIYRTPCEPNRFQLTQAWAFIVFVVPLQLV